VDFASPRSLQFFSDRRAGAGLALALALGTFGCSPASPGGGSSAPQGPATPLVGQAAPEIHADKVSGEGPATLAAAKGKVVVLDFWATYCQPCKKSFPRYEELMKAHANDVAVIAISVDGADDASKEQIAAFGKNVGVTFAIVWDKDATAVKSYRPPKMPSSYIIDRKGVVRTLHAGYEDGEETRIAADVERLIAEH
jgi:cytochrome c biogenesis protein CcmG/thiol:disulfide interchange protein DsbE